MNLNIIKANIKFQLNYYSQPNSPKATKVVIKDRNYQDISIKQIKWNKSKEVLIKLTFIKNGGIEKAASRCTGQDLFFLCRILENQESIILVGIIIRALLLLVGVGDLYL